MSDGCTCTTVDEAHRHGRTMERAIPRGVGTPERFEAEKKRWQDGFRAGRAVQDDGLAGRSSDPEPAPPLDHTVEALALLLRWREASLEGTVADLADLTDETTGFLEQLIADHRAAYRSAS